MSDGAALEARMRDLEQNLATYKVQCEQSTARIGAKLDRIMTAALGDHDLGAVGFIEQGRRQYESILCQVNSIHESQSESRKHRTVHLNIPVQIAELSVRVDDLMNAAHEEEITMRAYRRLVGWVIVGVNGSWAAGVAIWSALT